MYQIQGGDTLGAEAALSKLMIFMIMLCTSSMCISDQFALPKKTYSIQIQIPPPPFYSSIVVDLQNLWVGLIEPVNLSLTINTDVARYAWGVHPPFQLNDHDYYFELSNRDVPCTQVYKLATEPISEDIYVATI